MQTPVYAPHWVGYVMVVAGPLILHFARRIVAGIGALRAAVHARLQRVLPAGFYRHLYGRNVRRERLRDVFFLVWLYLFGTTCLWGGITILLRRP